MTFLERVAGLLSNVAWKLREAARRKRRREPEQMFAEPTSPWATARLVDDPDVEIGQALNTLKRLSPFWRRVIRVFEK